MRVGAISGFMMSVAVAGLVAQGMPETAKAELKDAGGQSMGTVTLTETTRGVLLHVALTNVPEGVHAFHLHTTGQCVAPFTTAGGHFNPTSKQHGFENPMGMHAGDMPNVTVPAGGKLTFDFLDTDVTLKAGANSLLDADGSAVVLHAGADDYKGDPAGNAGARLACGVVTK
ncbi:MAG TPA: superoxide dismutase family protein [Vicinamibacterales bacterium]|nr:superoxide dismutase family protein [Vicinamibacterales bacterium]